MSREQLAEFLKLCKGDETWATNLLLDSNKVSLAKRSKKNSAASMSITGLNKRMYCIKLLIVLFLRLSSQFVIDCSVE